MTGSSKRNASISHAMSTSSGSRVRRLGHDGDVVEAVGTASGLADADLDVSHGGGPSVPFGEGDIVVLHGFNPNPYPRQSRRGSNRGAARRRCVRLPTAPRPRRPTDEVHPAAPPPTPTPAPEGTPESTPRWPSGARSPASSPRPGRCSPATGLDERATATTVRVRDGERVAHRRPVRRDARSRSSASIIIDVADLDAAIGGPSKMPSARLRLGRGPARCRRTSRTPEPLTARAPPAGPRAGVPRGVGQGPRDAGRPGRRRPRPRRGRASQDAFVAAAAEWPDHGVPDPARRLAHHRGPPPGHRPPPPRADPRAPTWRPSTTWSSSCADDGDARPTPPDGTTRAASPTTASGSSSPAATRRSPSRPGWRSRCGPSAASRSPRSPAPSSPASRRCTSASVRAKRKIEGGRHPLPGPAADELPERLGGVLHVVYLDLQRGPHRRPPATSSCAPTCATRRSASPGSSSS